MDDDEEEDTDLPLLCRLTNNDCRHLKIVGIRYYRGVAYEGEYVRLAREPSNPYDRNAIRVDNLRHEKVGHVAKEAAAILSPIWDQFGDQVIKFDASIPWRGSHYHHPLQLEIRAPQSLWETLKPLLAPLIPSAASKQSAVSVASKKVDWKQQQAQLDELWKDLLEKQLHGLPDIDVPEALTSPLFAHQRQALNWLVHRENSTQNPFYEETTENGKTVYLCQLTMSSQPQVPAPIRGGILADDMGLGKTLSTIALILAQPPPSQFYNPGQHAPKPISASEYDDDADSVSPPSKKELRLHSVGDLRKVAFRLLSSGNHAIMKKSELVNLIHQAMEDRKILPRAFEEALKAPVPLKSPPMNSLPLTLIICPVSVISNWQDQIDAHVMPHTLRVACYQGPHRHGLLAQVGDYDIFITSYHTLQADHRPIEAQRKAAASGTAPPKKAKNSTIFDVPFFRVILDEAHTVRNHKSGMFKACFALNAERRLCISGTPITNKPDDIHSLFQFLRLEPLGDRDVFRRSIAQPIKDGGDRGLANLRLSMACTALRRTKLAITLPDKRLELRSVSSAPDNPHQQIYETIFQAARAAFGAVLQQKDKKVSHTSMFEILTRLRQACCSGSLVPKGRLLAAEQVLATVQQKNALTAAEGRELLDKLKGALLTDEIDGAPECAICMEEMSAAAAVVLRQCGHVFCNSCLQRTLDFKTVCAFCRRPYREDDLIPYQRAEAASTEGAQKTASLTDDWQSMGPSPKMNALLLALDEMQPDEKGVVFSQFTKFLDQLESFLTENGWSFVRIDGSKSRTQRIQAIQEFGGEEGPRLVLCSLHAAGTGINLTRGSRVFLMDTWWNEAIELQAQDRVHRLGQSRTCRVVRFVAADSVESRMVELQKAKAALGKGAFESLSAEEKRKARMSDLKKLLEL
eukprot:scaffold1488_cov141-Amphora_coffeaeformis.AAC.4